MRVLNCYKKYWLWLVLAFLLLYLAMLLSFGGNKWREIETDVASGVTQSLTKAGYQWPQVQTKDRGRDVLISGKAPSESVKNKVIQLAESTADDRGNIMASSVTWAGKVSPPVVLKAPNFSADINQEQVVLQGELASQKQIDDLVRSANQQFGADKVVNRLTVGKNLKSLNRLNDLFNGFGVGVAQLNFKGEKVTLNGNTSSEKLKSDAGRLLATRLGGSYQISNLIKVIKPKPKVEKVPVVEPVPEVNNICQNDLSSLMSESTILFASSQARIKPESHVVLDRVSSVLQQCPDAYVEIIGHTDNTGLSDSNLVLSKNRAQAVVNYLVQKGANENHLSASGMGSTQPIADNKTATGRAKNRRIEFTIK